MIKSLWALGINQMTVNRGILCHVWELLDTDEIRLLQLIPRQNIPEILRAITEARLGLEKALAKERIQWKFITAKVLCGELWFHSTMNALRKTSRGALLKHNELYTILCEIEASIYDRALVFMGDDLVKQP
ncbi:hypothetical protein T4E_5328 [Trichinella pseudospiralis]|uniref:Uncharacterized protein n=1 Tax=Trichinella pseudospiralis TaxID=6337 RepID=A0A0V0YKJ8_TRIPS|nr:hypothetical protein T4E_5328 [Trichinella pseudospiralis]